MMVGDYTAGAGLSYAESSRRTGHARIAVHGELPVVEHLDGWCLASGCCPKVG